MFSGLLEKNQTHTGPKRYNTTYQENLARTEKGRQKIAVNRVLKRTRERPAASSAAEKAGCILADAGDSDPTDFKSRLQRSFFTKNFLHAQYQDPYLDNPRLFERDRGRCVYSAIVAVVKVLVSMATIDSGMPKHVLNCNVIDDTSTRLRGPNPSDPTTIFTVMNSVQSVHVRYANAEDVCDHCSTTVQSFNVPTPLLVLESADANAISLTAKACSLITSSGVGQLFQRFGVPCDLFQKMTETFRTFVFVGDSLRANDKAFALEKARLVKKREAEPSYHRNLALKLRCMIHQVALIRKPVVLLIPRFWSTLVRISHLYETTSFRKQMATALTQVICSSFVNIQSMEYPPNMATWQARAKQLEACYLGKSKKRRKLLSDCLKFCNGDLTQHPVVHYCSFDSKGQPCCSTEEESLAKCLQLLVPFFSAGFSVPLLYKFKHFDEAAGFMQVGCFLHGLLVRALACLDNTDQSSVPSEVIEKLLGDLEAPLNDTEFQDAINELSAADLGDDFQTCNLKRRQLVQAEIARPAFTQSAYILNMVIKPMDHIMNKLFQRSAVISKLTSLGQDDPNLEEHMTTSKQTFLDLMSGKLGWDMVGVYSDLLANQIFDAVRSGLVPTESTVQTTFTMAVMCITDSWRRFVHEHASFLHVLFKLVECDKFEFCCLWDTFHVQLQRCSRCVDCEFSRALLTAFPSNLLKAPMDVSQQVFETVTNILNDLCVFAPISSDQVEVKNGVVQLVASRRGNQAVKAPRSARESSFLRSLLNGYNLVQHYVEEETLPKKRTIAGIIKRSGITKEPWRQ